MANEPPFISDDMVINLALWATSDMRLVDACGFFDVSTSDAEQIREACRNLYRSRTGREVPL
jgi:hypothetical protein